MAGACALCLAIVAVALAGFQPIDQQLKLSTTGSSTDNRSALNPQVAFDPQRKQFLVIWQSDPQVVGDYEIYGQRLNLTGAKLGSRFKISNAGGAGTQRDALNPAVVYNPTTQRFLVVWWGDENATNNDLEIWGRSVNAVTGAPVGTDFQISNAAGAGASRDADGPEVAYNPTDNEFMVVWRADELPTDNEFEMWGRRLDGNGVPQGSDFRISNIGTDGDITRGVPETTHKPEGAVVYNPQAHEYLVAWPGNQVSPSKFEIYGQRLSAAGAEVPSSTDFRISQTGADSNGMRDATSVDLAYDSHDNQYLAIFNADRSTTGTTDTEPFNEEEVYGQRLSAAGAEIPTATDFRVSITGPEGNTHYDSNTPNVEYGAPQDEYLVVWTSTAILGQVHTFGQHLNGSAGKIGGNFRISRGNAYHLYPDLTRARSSKEYMTTWEASFPGADYEVFARRVGQSATCAGRLATRQGTSQKDTINGGSSADVFATLGAKDVGNGGGGNDKVCGGGGTGDTVRGNGGNDFLDGGPGGGDKCIGGAGTDTFAASCETKTQ